MNQRTKAKRIKRIAYTKVITKGRQGDWFLEISNPLTNDLVHISIGQFDSSLAKNLRRLKLSEKEITDYFTHTNNRNSDGRCKTFRKVILVRVNDSLATVQSFGVLIHELLHASYRLIERWEKNLRFHEREELMCSLQNFYFEQVVTATSAGIHIYGNKKLSWKDTFFLDHYYEMKKRK